MCCGLCASQRIAVFKVHKGVVFVHMWVACTNTLVNLLIFKNIAFKRQVACLIPNAEDSSLLDPKCFFLFSINLLFLKL